MDVVDVANHGGRITALEGTFEAGLVQGETATFFLLAKT